MFLSFKFLIIYFCVTDCVFVFFVQIVVNSVVVFKIIEVGLNGNLGALNFESPLTVCEGLGMTRIWSSCDIMCSSVLCF